MKSLGFGVPRRNSSSVASVGHRRWPAAGRLVSLTLFLVLTAAVSATAQQAAGIIGQVADESGAVLPGVTVTTTSPALQVPSVVAVTDERGEYRLSPLPIGTYTVEFTLPGFQTVRHEGVRLTVGFTARVDGRLNVGALQETITVSGATPVVDTRSTTATTQFTKESIELLPSSRNGIVSLLAQAPGVRTLRDVGGSSINQVPTYRVFGQSGEAYSTLEGVQTSTLQGSSGQANYWDYTTIEEASVRTIGNSAEVPSRGVNLTAVVKSGSNAFHGSAGLNKTSSTLQSDNVDANLAAQGVELGARLISRHSYSADLGGRIIRDKLWFYTAGRRAINATEVVNTFKPDGSPAIADDLSWFSTQKISYQMSNSNRFVGFHQYNHKYDLSELGWTTTGTASFRPWEYRGGIMTPSRTAKLEWQKVSGTSLVTSLQYGFWTYNSRRWDFSPLDVPPSFDQVTLVNEGAHARVGERPHNPRHHYKGAMTWFRPDLMVGNHEFKFGFDYTSSWFGRQYPELPAEEQFKGAYSSAVYNHRLLYQNGAAYQLEVWNNPAYAQIVSHYLGLYTQDSWTLGRRLTLNLGVRYAHDNGFVPESCREAARPPGHIAFPATCYERQQFNIWNTVAPRLHAAWDVTGDGKTMVKGGWGRFDHMRQQVPELDSADPNVRSVVTYRWRDLNGNRNYDPGETNLDPNGADFVSQSGGVQGISSLTSPSPDEREPKTDELSLTFERELMQDFALRVSGIYSRYHDTYRLLNLLRPYDAYSVPVTRPDPGPDGRVGTADDPGVAVTYYEFPTSLRGRQFERFVRVNDSKADQTFKSIDLALFKRLSRSWQFLGSYSVTRRNVPVIFTNQTGPATDANIEFNSNVESGPLNPNAEINTLDREWERSAKLSGVYMFPHQIMASANFEHRSGYPWARQVRFTGGQTIPNITLNVEPIGTRRLPSSNQLDVRVEKTFNLANRHKLAVRMNIFNALNANEVLTVSRISGPTFGLPTAITPPRIAEFSMSYNF